MAATQTATARLREEWLANLARLFVPVIEARASVTVPAFRVTCGFPSRGGELGGKTRVRGQCWTPDASGDGHAEIFISPVEDDAKTVAAILAHELMHAALGVEEGHGRAFQRAMSKLGHVAPFTTSNPTAEFEAWTAPLLDKVGAYPHASLQAMRAVGQPKKQSARLLKAVCTVVDAESGAACGYCVRVTRKWADVGAPVCPKHMAAMEVEAPEGEGEADPVPEDMQAGDVAGEDLAAAIVEAAEDVDMIRGHLETEEASRPYYRGREGKAFWRRQVDGRRQGLEAAQERLETLRRRAA